MLLIKLFLFSNIFVLKIYFEHFERIFSMIKGKFNDNKLHKESHLLNKQLHVINAIMIDADTFIMPKSRCERRCRTEYC